MSMVPLRNLGKLGVLTDPESYDLPPEAFSMGVNVRFDQGRAERGPVFWNYGELASTPAYLLSYVDSTGNQKLLYTDISGYIFDWAGGVETAKSPASGWTPAASFEPSTTSVVINDVVYVNRSDRTPWYRAKSASGAFATLHSYNSGNGLTQFDSTFRFRSLRALAGCLIGIHCTEGANVYPNKYRWSNFTDFGVPPLDWDQASASSSSGANTVADMKGDLMDGVPLRDSLMLYSTKEAWNLEFIGGNDMFRIRKSFDKGMVNVNCGVEIDGKHYIFGTRDIWVNDGVGQKSLSVGRVNNFIFRNMDRSKDHFAFVFHDPNLTEVRFCYISNDQYCYFPATGAGCNRAASYNYESDTWSFYDLPYLTSAYLASTSTALTWAAATASWATTGLTYSGSGGDSFDVVLTASLDHAPYSITRSLRSFEPYEASSLTTIDAAASARAYLERYKMDLDEVGAELDGYKLVSTIYPQARLSADAAGISFQFGSCDHPTAAPLFGTAQDYDETYNRVDHDQAGRFLSMKATFDDYKHFTLSGLDLDIKILSN